MATKRQKLTEEKKAIDARDKFIGKYFHGRLRGLRGGENVSGRIVERIDQSIYTVELINDDGSTEAKELSMFILRDSCFADALTKACEAYRSPRIVRPVA